MEMWVRETGQHCLLMKDRVSVAGREAPPNTPALFVYEGKKRVPEPEEVSDCTAVMCTTGHHDLNQSEHITHSQC